jgi:hypothetical protein
MPTTLDVRADDRLLRFRDDLRVQTIGADGSVSAETDWESVSGEKENEISFRFAGETRTSLAVKYAFNERNQLTLQVVKQPGVPQASAAWTLQGKIFIDDVADVEYVLVDDLGNLTNRKMEVYATLDFSKGYQGLQVKFPDGTATVITGSNGERSVSAGEYVSGGDLARDLLSFNAVTRNTIAGKPKNASAVIKFCGRWDMHENSLVFVTRYDNSSSANPIAYLAIAGEIKGTNFGLVVEKDGTAAFQIGGRYSWNKNTLGWDLNVGYSRAAGLEARLGVDAAFDGKAGRLTLKGGATLRKGSQGTNLTFDLAIKYSAKDKTLVFTLEGDGKGYELHLSGDFKISNSFVKFEITAADKNGKKTVKGSVEFGSYTENSDLKASLEAVLGPKGITLKANLEFRFYWGATGPVAELP